ncbi:hypothetical protein [Streptomyces laurentii]
MRSLAVASGCVVTATPTARPFPATVVRIWSSWAFGRSRPDSNTL